VSSHDTPAPDSADAATLAKLTVLLQEGHSLDEYQAADAAVALARESASVESKTKFLRELTSSNEDDSFFVLGAFAIVFLAHARNPGVGEWADKAIDVCGTGGDHSGSYNISTTVAFILAAEGIPVFKHGNRSITSKSGSADFLSANGIPLEAPDGVWQNALRELNFAFFFAPAYHPAFKHVSASRKILAAEGCRTIFNLLGPLLNPGRPAYQLIGVSKQNYLQQLALGIQFLRQKTPNPLPTRRGLIVHGQLSGPDGLDEMSVIGNNLAIWVGEPWNKGRICTWNAVDAGLQPGNLSDLAGGDAQFNLTLLDALLGDRAPKGLRDTVYLNAGAALWVAERVNDLKSGVAEARRLLTTGPVRDWLKRTREFFQDHKA